MSKTRYTMEERCRIANEHAKSHNGFRGEEFLAAAENADHPAHDWFNWDDGEAAHKYRLWQSRRFVSDITIEVHMDKPTATAPGEVKLEVRVETKTAPMFVSPLETRNEGGGYIPTDTEEGRSALGREAAQRLGEWIERYESVLADAEQAMLESLKERIESDC